MSKQLDHFSIAEIRAALEQHTCDQLRALASLLTTDRLQTRKGDLVNRIEGHLEGDNLRAIWNRLDRTQQQAVAETLFSPGGRFEAQKFRAKYGRDPVFGSKHQRGYGETPSLLRLFLYPAGGNSGGPSVIPDDLARRLRDFVPRPEPVSLHGSDELPEHDELVVKTHEWQAGDSGITVIARGSVYRVPRQKPMVKTTTHTIPLVRRDTERDALVEVGILLKLVDLGRLAVSDKTALPGTAALQEVSAVLSGGDFYPPEARESPLHDPIGPIKAYAWPLLLQAGGLAELRGRKLALTKTGQAALTKPAADTVRGLWQRWIKNKPFDEFNRIDCIKGQQGKGKRSMTAASGRRAVIAGALAECPAGMWIRFDDFCRYLQAAGCEFDISRNPWDLYIGDARYGSLGHSGFHDWSILQQRYLACLLFEYAATLGLLDIGYVEPWQVARDFSDLWGTDDLSFLSRYDGLRWFRVNPLGAYCLGLADTYQARDAASKTALSVLPSLQLKITSGTLTLEEALFLETWAVQESGEHWRLDRGRILTALEQGRRVEEIREFLEARDAQGLPDTVAGFLATTERSATVLKMTGPVLLIECKDEAIADAVAGNPVTRSLCRRVGPKTLSVRIDAEDRFRKAVNGLGFGLPRT